MRAGLDNQTSDYTAVQCTVVGKIINKSTRPRIREFVMCAIMWAIWGRKKGCWDAMSGQAGLVL
jgi:hypothetical protein